jgi:ABC-type uncharacterized transport system involved in gliding motility auxiliary subunit
VFTLSVPADQVALLQTLVILILPGLALITGAFVWWRRRA